MIYIESCLISSILNILMILFFIIYIYVQYKKNKETKTKFKNLLLVITIFIAPNTFFNLNFYYEYLNNPEIHEVVEVECIKTRKLKSSIFGGYSGYNDVQFLQLKDSREFLLEDYLAQDEVVLGYEKESLDIMKTLVEEGELSDVATTYIDEMENEISEGSKFKITYKKTSRYNVVTNIEKINESI